LIVSSLRTAKKNVSALAHQEQRASHPVVELTLES